TTVSQTAAVAFTTGPVSASGSGVVASPTSLVADGSAASTVTVTLRDAYGHPVSGKDVTLAQGTGSSTITTVSGTTDAAGHASFTVKDAGVENVTYTATDTTDGTTITQAPTVTFRVGAVSASASTATASASTLLADNSTASTITVTLKDAYGHPVPGKSVSLDQGSASSTIATVTGTTNATGHAVFTVKDATVESVTYTATDTTDGVDVTQTPGVDFTLGPVSATASTVAASPASLTADGSSTSTVTVTLNDDYGHPVPGKAVLLSQGPGNS